MAEIKIELRPIPGSSGLRASSARLAKLKSARNFPATARAVEALTRDAQKVMLGAARGRFVQWSGGTFRIRSVSGRLAAAIRNGLRYPYQGNPLKGAIVINHPHYLRIRDGIGPYDMKPGLLSSPRAKVGKNGRYVSVPIKVDPDAAFSRVVFRMVTERSKGWIHPGTLPRRIDLYTQETMRPRMARAIARAMAQDLKG